MNNNEDIGYLKRAVEELTKTVISHMEKEEADRKELMERIDTIEKELSNARAIGKALRMIAYFLLAVLTFKLGDFGRFL